METRSQRNIEKTTSSEPRGLNRFLCRIAGSDLRILAQCPHEISRHARVGAVIISTSLLAFVSMFFAIQTVSKSSVTGFFAGLVWGTVIFVLDSYIVASYKKNDNKWKEFRVAVPRLILALVLGCSVSIPLELKVFENEIFEQVKIIEIEDEIAQKKKALESYNKDIEPFVSEKTSLQNDIDNLNVELQPLIDKVNRLEKELADEIGGVGRTGKLSYGPVARQLNMQLTQAKSDRYSKENEITPKIASKSKRVQQLDSLIATTPIRPTSKVNLYGISAQLKGLERLTNSNSYVLVAYWVFFLLVLGIETSPIFVKFFTPKGSYDEIYAMNEYITYMEQQKKKSDLHEMINSEVEAIRSLNLRKKTAQDSVNENLMNEIATAQGEIAEKAIRLWKERQLERVEQDLTSFIKSNEEVNMHRILSPSTNDDNANDSQV